VLKIINQKWKGSEDLPSISKDLEEEKKKK